MAICLPQLSPPYAFINDDTDGVVHGLQNCKSNLADGADDDPVQMVSAFRAMPSLIAIK